MVVYFQLFKISIKIRYFRFQWKRSSKNNQSIMHTYKAYGHDDISIRMIQICDRTLLKPLIILYQNSIKCSHYSDIWKRSNIIPVQKIVINSYLRIIDPFLFYQSLVKIWKRIFNKVYPNQLGFCQSDSCVNQLLAITHEIYEAFNCNPPLEVRLVHLDISKTFEKVWHDGLLYKLKSVGISGELYNLLENYLSGKFQRVVLNG